MTCFLRLMDDTDLDWAVCVEQRVHSVPWSRKGFEQSLTDGLSFLITDQQDLRLGYLVCLPVLDEVHLLNIAVDKPYQGRGVAQQALSALIARLADTKYSTILLEVRESNHVACHLYQKLGFKRDGLRKDYYPTPTGRENAQLMSLVL